MSKAPPALLPAPQPTPDGPPLGTVILGAGNTSAAARRRVSFRQGALDGVNAAFEHLGDGTSLLRFGERLADPAPEVQIGESVCQGGG